MCSWRGHGRRADEDLMRICTAFGIAGADASEGILGWLGKGKYTLPNISGSLKTTECSKNPSRTGKSSLLKPLKPHLLFMAGLALFAQRLRLEAHAANSILSPLSSLSFSRCFITWHPLLPLLSDYRNVYIVCNRNLSDKCKNCKGKGWCKGAAMCQLHIAAPCGTAWYSSTSTYARQLWCKEQHWKRYVLVQLTFISYFWENGQITHT